MLRALGSISRRLDSLRQSGSALRAASVQHEEGLEATSTVITLNTSQYVSTSRDVNISDGSLPVLRLPLVSLSSRQSSEWSLSSLSAEPSSASTSELADRDDLTSFRSRSLQCSTAAAAPWTEPPAWMGLATASHSARCLGRGSPLHHHPYGPLHLVHFASSSSAKGGASKGSAGKSAKPKPGAGAGAAAAGTADAQAVPRRTRTPDWARMPSQAGDLQDLFRKRRAQLSRRRVMLEEELRKVEGQGWSAGAKAAEAAAAVAALPIAPPDGGAGQLAAATAPSTSFDAALEAMSQLVRVGVVLAADPTLTALLRKATSADQLRAALGLLRRNHLAQAAVRLGAHEPRHGALHGVLVQECQRLGAAAPLVDLWESIYEHGMEPTGPAACAAVRCAVVAGDGAAAAALLGLTSQYSLEPLAAAEAPSVVKLLESGGPDAAAKLRELLPKLGM